MPRKKKLQQHIGSPESEVTVELYPIEHYNPNHAKYIVYRDGERLGVVESYTGQTHRHLYGRVGTFGKPRKFWSATPESGGRFGNRFASMADGIRWLLP